MRARPENTAFFTAVQYALDAAAEYLGPVALPGGLPLEKWLDGVDPPALDSTAAGACVHVHQLCHLQPAAWGPADGVVAALGHSIGLQAAVVAGLRPTRLDEFLDLVAASVRLVVVSLVRAHQVAPDPEPDPALVAAYRGSRGAAPGPMASVTGMSREELDDLLTGTADTADTADTAGAPATTVTLGLLNAPTAHVLSGPTAALLALRAARPEFERPGVTWAFLPNTIPFHTPALAPVVDRVRADADFTGPWPTPDRLAIPVYAADGPRNLQHADDLVDEYLRQVFVRPIDWAPAAGHAVADAEVTRILDCGPGAGARRFTRESLRTRVRFESVRPPRRVG
ncbi:hypothetical protein [Saccharothrix sp. Mg75]|uniref:hypothetical protein n=1 Tax=Saccharothrix sp. Mg75 TaxID=3445357 RepID=UPI003EE96C55